MDTAPTSLRHLSDAANVEVRTLRSWMKAGLLPGPVQSGRYASYPPGTLERALAIKGLRDVHGMSLERIREELGQAGTDRLQGYASLPGKVRELGLDAPVPAAGKGVSDYLASLRETGAMSSGKGRPATPSPPTDAPLPMLVRSLEANLGAQPPRRSKGRPQVTIPVNPDVDIVLKGDVSQATVTWFEHAADAIRETLAGGKRSGG